MVCGRLRAPHRLSEVGPETIRRAAAVHPIVDLQIEYAWSAAAGNEDLSPTRRTRHRGHNVWCALARPALRLAALGRGRHACAPAALQGRKPRRQPATCRSAPHDRSIQKHHAVQLAIAWVLAKGPSLIPWSAPAPVRRLPKPWALST